MSNARNNAFKLKNSVTPMEYGAAPGVDCATAVTDAAAAVSAAGGGEIVFPQGAWVITTLPTIPLHVLIRALPGATFSGAGAVSLGLPSGQPSSETRINYTTDGDDYAGLELIRHAYHTGGTPGNVASNLLVRSVTGPGVTNYEWAITAIVDNHTPEPTAGHVAVYAQGNKYAGAGLTWAGAFEARDRSGAADPTAGLVGLEVDVFADGTDVNEQRVGIDVVGGVGVTIGPFIGHGIRIGPQNNNPLNCTFHRGLHVYGVALRGISIATEGASVVGLDISEATLTGPAIRIAEDQGIAFEASDTEQLKYDGTGIGYYSGGTMLSRMNGDGSLAIRDGIAAPATVVGMAQIYVDTADGDLKVKYGDGTVKTIVVDT